MKKILCLAALALLPVATLAVAQDKKATPASMSDDPMMAKMMEFATPGAAHKVLESRIGKWNLEVKMFQPDGKPADSSTATAETKWILDGRFVEDTTQGSFGDMAFHGRGMTGYDNMKKKYVTTWMDNMSTGIMVSEGTYDAGTKTFNFTGEGPDCMAGKYVKTRIVDTTTDNDHWTMKMYMPGPDGKEYMAMQIDYARAK